ncbi:hypothetical protein AURDEDRAFT_175863 [Auricularia subglabra TFB-10046 SS5]|nr:hypothetical protein AURDEDRAFT_175863 [Auricularia subglabra TFB-10046 SS5]
MKTQYNKRCGASRQYKIGNKVWLEATNLKLAVSSKKLAERRFGPFEVLEQSSTRASSREAHPPPPPTVVDDHEEYEVEEVLDSKKKGRSVRYLVKWVGYGRKHNQWVTKTSLANALGAVHDFIRKNPDKPHNVQALTFDQSLLPPDFFDHQHTTGIDFSLPDAVTASTAGRSHRA